MSAFGTAPSARLKSLITELAAMDKRGVFDCCHRDVRYELRTILANIDEQAERVAHAEDEARPLTERELPRFDILRPRPSLRLVTPVPVLAIGDRL